MDAHPNPRNRVDPELIFSTPLPESSAAAAAFASASAARTLTTDTASPFEPLRSASGPRNRAPHSKKKTVLLCDWWLLWAPEAHEGRRLSVGGVVAEPYKGPCRHEGDRSGSKFLLSPWQKAQRVFESAPITKRYDSFTLGTADGITLRIQGVVNKACSHQKGIPPEVCNSFLIGFPYNWDKYAGACFEGIPESAASGNEISKGLTDPEGFLFPVLLDDFSMSRIHDDSIDDSLTRKFKDFREKFCYTTKSLAPTSDTQDKTRSDTIMRIHPTKEKILGVSITKNQNSQSKRGKKKQQSSPSEKILDVSITKNQNSQSKRGKKQQQSSPSIYQAYKKGRSLHGSSTTIWRPSYDNRYPLTRDTAKKLCIASPESLNLKRSRTGRLLVPPISQWCQKIIYDANGEITAITGEGLENLPCRESPLEPPRKRKRLI